MPDWFTFNFQPLEQSNRTALGRRVSIYRLASIIHPTTKYLWQTFQTHPAAVLNPSCTALKTLPTSPAGLSPAMGWNPPATRMGAPHLTHLCVHGPPARLCETNSLFSSSGARSRLRRGGAHCAALPRQWRHMGNRRISRSPFQRATTSAAYYVRQRSLEGYIF